MDSTQFTELVEFGEAEAYADMFAAAPADWGLCVERLGSAIALVAPPINTMLFNRVLGLGVIDPASEIHLMEAMALYRQAGVRHLESRSARSRNHVL